MSLEGSVHRNTLEAPAIAFNSLEGRQLFTECLQGGYLNGYFYLAEHYTTQGNPGFCGLGSLTMALNSLMIDPQRVWQGMWRWFDENMLDCCESLDVIRKCGITLPKLACIAKCNGANVNLHFATEITIDELRRDVIRASLLPDNEERCVVIVSYHRQALNQIGTGHFSPIGAYHPGTDRVLIFDVARFKYPPHWLPLTELHEAMKIIDNDTGKSRGYMLLTASQRLYCKNKCQAICFSEFAENPLAEGNNDSDNSNNDNNCDNKLRT